MKHSEFDEGYVNGFNDALLVIMEASRVGMKESLKGFEFCDLWHCNPILPNLKTVEKLIKKRVFAAPSQLPKE